MKAMVQSRYGSAEVLELANIERPTIDDTQVLVAVRAASIGAWVTHMMKGDPLLMRLGFGIRRPRQRVRASDFAGEVVAVGSKVHRFNVGDEVYGEGESTFAEFVAVSPESLSLKPNNLSFDQAAAVPVAGQTALIGLRDYGGLQPGQSVLIIGAAGGVGTFAVQIAKALGAEVTGVCSSQSVELVGAIGADHVIDYEAVDFATSPERYDVVFQLAGTRSLSELRNVLTERGTLVLSSGEGGPWLGPLPRLAKALITSPFVRQDLRTFVAKTTPKNLAELTRLIEDGQLIPVINEEYQLAEMPDAVRRFERSHTQGKIVVTI